MPLYVAKLINPLVLEHSLSADDEAAVLEAVGNVREYLQSNAPYVALLKNHQELEKHFKHTDQEHEKATTLRTAQHLDAMMLETNRLLMNFLASARSYIDLTDRRLGKQRDSFAMRFRAWRSVQYDDSFSYRLCEALRNVAQHQDLPVTAYTSSTTVQSDGTIASAQQFMIDRESLLESPKIKGVVRIELSSLSSNIEIRSHIAEYMNRLNNVQLQVERERIGQYTSYAQLLEQTVRIIGDPRSEPIGFVRREGAEDAPQLNLIDPNLHGTFLILNAAATVQRMDFGQLDAAAKRHPKWPTEATGAGT